MFVKGWPVAVRVDIDEFFMGVVCGIHGLRLGLFKAQLDGVVYLNGLR
jgi:hypothetical protein